MSEFENMTTPPPAPGGTASSEDRTLALITHLSGILLSFIVPLIIWLTNKDKADKAFLTDQSKEALNFQITIAIAYVVCMILAVVIIGGLLAPIVWLVNIAAEGTPSA